MRRAQTLNEAPFRKVLHYCRTRRHANQDTALFMVSFFAGLRAKEIAALKLGDVFDDKGRVHFGNAPDQRRAAAQSVHQQTSRKSAVRLWVGQKLEQFKSPSV